MSTDRAFEFDDLAILLGLDFANPADLADIEAIEAILDRRRLGGWSAPAAPARRAPTLHVVPDEAP